jgi:cell division protein FtsI (penicillin-binding protein 3)
MRRERFFKEDQKRLVWVSCFVFFLLSLLVIQFYRIQIVEGDKWTLEAKAQHQFTVIEPFKRGLFYSHTSLKTGHPEEKQSFVVDIAKFHLYVDPLSIPQENKREVAQKISLFLRLDQSEKEKCSAQFDKHSRSRKLAMWLAKDVKEQIQSWWHEYVKGKKIPRNALYFIQDYQRSYPFGSLLGQVLHTVREERDLSTHQSIPTGGLEFVFNRVLQGKEGKRTLLRSPRHPLDCGQLITAPENGADVYLTVNHYIQAIAEEEICKAVKRAKAKSGWAIMMEPRTGEIWAFAQYPFFDPSDYRRYYNTPELADHTKVKALTDPYEPGSTFKPITLAICLKANEEMKKRGKPPLFSPSEKVGTSNGSFPGRSKPIKDTHHHSWLNMELAMQKSSNIYMARMIQRVVDALGDRWYRSALQDLFGFGQKTGIELPSETVGLLPTPGKMHPSCAIEWSKPTPYSLAFGHNILVNSLQMLRAYAIIANGGYDVKPTLIRKIVKTRPDGAEDVLLDHTKPERLDSFKRLLEPEIARQMIQAMKLVTKPGGTASKADIYGYTEAGKTGTSEKIVNGVYSKNIHFSSFIGFTPAEHPRFILMIGIDEPEYKYIPGVGKNHHGGNCAAPAFKEIASRTLQYLGVEPDDPFGYPQGDPRSQSDKADMAQKIKDLKALYKQWNHHP